MFLLYLLKQIEILQDYYYEISTTSIFYLSSLFNKASH